MRERERERNRVQEKKRKRGNRVTIITYIKRKLVDHVQHANN